MLGINLNHRKNMIPFQKQATLNNIRRSSGMTNKKSKLQLARKGKKEERGQGRQTRVFKSDTDHQ